MAVCPSLPAAFNLPHESPASVCACRQIECGALVFRLLDAKPLTALEMSLHSVSFLLVIFPQYFSDKLLIKRRLSSLCSSPLDAFLQPNGGLSPWRACAEKCGLRACLGFAGTDRLLQRHIKGLGRCRVKATKAWRINFKLGSGTAIHVLVCNPAPVR